MSREETAGRNPVWTEDETTLALELYLRHRPRHLDKSHPEVVGLSAELRDLALANGISGSETFRNPVGVSMKLGNLKAGDPTLSGRGLPHGSKIEEKVWARYGSDSLSLSTAVEAIRSKFRVYPSAREEEYPEVVMGASKGPAPFIGRLEHIRSDGENALYVLRLTGPVESVFSNEIEDGHIIAKVGRSNDVTRRVAEMNYGFPPGLQLRWLEFFSRTFSSAQEAHDVEQRLLSLLSKDGVSLGKEFALVHANRITMLVDRACKSD